MTTCIGCGTAIREGDLACEKCGAPIEPLSRIQWEKAKRAGYEAAKVDALRETVYFDGVCTSAECEISVARRREKMMAAANAVLTDMQRRSSAQVALVMDPDVKGPALLGAPHHGVHVLQGATALRCAIQMSRNHDLWRSNATIRTEVDGRRVGHPHPPATKQGQPSYDAGTRQ
jgi:hypothetical protein